MKNTKTRFSAVSNIGVALALLAAAAVPFLSNSFASAATFEDRSIQMSDSTPSATGVQYDVTVTPQASGNVLGIVLEFCDNSPLIGDACTATAGTDVPDVSSAALAGWTVDGATDGNTLVLTRGAGTWTASTPETLSVTGVDNPSNGGANGTFYARFFSYDTAAKAQGYTSANPSAVGAPIDTGGFAMSTADRLTITARVQEKLTFCIYTGVDCATGGSSLQLGNNGVLDETQPYNNADAKFDVYTNASGGVVVRAKTFATPGHTLTSGSNTISAIGGTAAASNLGTEQFGFCVATSGGAVTSVAPYTGVEGGSGTCADDLTTGTYNQGTTNTRFAFDSAATQTTFGDDIASSTGPSATTVGTLNFLGNIGITTEAGIYTTELALIATGTF
jgi:hypothetical protein